MKTQNGVELHPEFLKKAGKIEFVVLPYEEFLALQEILADAEDILDLRAAKKEDGEAPGKPLREVKQDFER